MGYILKYIFLWLFMATVVTSCDRRSWFYNTTKPSEWEGAPFGFHKYISVVRFEKITASICFSNKPIPYFRDISSSTREIWD